MGQQGYSWHWGAPRGCRVSGDHQGCRRCQGALEAVRGDWGMSGGVRHVRGALEAGREFRYSGESSFYCQCWCC